MMLVTALLLLAQAPTATAPEATPRPAPNGPVVVLETSLGKIRIGLHQDKAPLSVKNFLTYVRAGHYDGTIWHRVIPGFMIQGGGFEPDMSERPTRPPIKNEAKNGLSNLRGTVALARTSDPNSATAQFYVNVKDNLSLDYGVRGAGYAVFGEVLEGMDVADRIVAVPTSAKGQFSDVPRTPVLIVRAREMKAAAPAAAKPKLATPAPPKP